MWPGTTYPVARKPMRDEKSQVIGTDIEKVDYDSKSFTGASNVIAFPDDIILTAIKAGTQLNAKMGIWYKASGEVEGKGAWKVVKLQF